MRQRTIKVILVAVTVTCLSIPQIAFASDDTSGFTAVAGTDKVVFDQRKKNNTALAVAAGLGTFVLFTIGLTATKKRAKLQS